MFEKEYSVVFSVVFSTSKIKVILLLYKLSSLTSGRTQFASIVKTSRRMLYRDSLLLKS